MQQAHRAARDSLQRSAVHQKRAYDHRASAPFSFSCGDAVWYYNPTIKKGVCQKLTCPWKGPFAIVRKLSDVTYMLQKGPRSDPFASHVDKLKKYNGQNVPRWYKDHIDRQQH